MDLKDLDNQELLGYLKLLKELYPVAFDDFYLPWYSSILYDEKLRTQFEQENPEWIKDVTTLIQNLRKKPVGKDPKHGLKPFVTDGCSGFMSLLWRKTIAKLPKSSPCPPWEDHCVIHDIAYWRGGTAENRKVADMHLLCEVTYSGYPIIAILMYLAVRLGGTAWLPLPWRWGYGRTFWRWNKYQEHEANVEVEDIPGGSMTINFDTPFFKSGELKKGK